MQIWVGLGEGHEEGQGIVYSQDVPQADLALDVILA